MARLAKVVNNEKKKKMSAKALKKRLELRKIIKNPDSSEEEKFEAHLKLQKMPRNSCENRVRNRCEVTGRPRAFMRAFRLSRIRFRELAHRGMIPGVTKSSW